MARHKKASKASNNHKMTDFFTSMPSSQPQRSSQPTPSSSQTSNLAKGRRPVRISDKDGNFASLVSKFGDMDHKYLEKVYLECNRDYGRAKAALHRERSTSVAPKTKSTTSPKIAEADAAFEKLKTLVPSLSREKFDDTYRSCGGDIRKTSRMLLSPEYRSTLRNFIRPGPSGSSSPATSSARKLNSKSSTTVLKSPIVPQMQPPILRQASTRSNRDITTSPTKSRPIPIPSRLAKKENAPPPDVISISSEHSHYTISSAVTPSHISISSTEPLAHREKRSTHLTVGNAVPELARRRSPRNQIQTVVQVDNRSPVKKELIRPRKKRKLSYASGSDEVVELMNDEDVIFAETWRPSPTQPVVKVEPPSSKPVSPTTKRKSVSPKKPAVKCRTKVKHASDEEDIEIIPSSQSDETELAAPKELRKDPNEVNESILRWQASSQTSGPLNEEVEYDASAEFDMDYTMDTGDDSSLPMEVDAPLEPPRSPTMATADLHTVSPTMFPSSPSPFIRNPPSTPRRTPPQSSSPTRCRVESTCISSASYRGAEKLRRPSPSPIITALPKVPAQAQSPKVAPSSASSFTKVGLDIDVEITPVDTTPLTPTNASKIAIPASSPLGKRRLVVEVEVPRLNRTPVSSVSQRTAAPAVASPPSPSSPSPPRELDTESKTNGFIARLKANPFARVGSPSDSVSDESDSARRLAPVGELSDSDSELNDGELDLFKKIGNGKRPSTPVTAKPADGYESPLTDLEDDEDIEDISKVSPPKLRRSGRHRVLSPSRSDAPTGTFAYSALHPPPGALPKTLAAGLQLSSTPKKPKRKSEGWDLAKLMKEKKANGGHAWGISMDLVMNEEESNGDAEDKLEGPSRVRFKEGDEDADGMLEEVDRQRLLGDDADGKVEKILNDDIARKGKGKSREIAEGIRLFEFSEEGEDGMDVDVKISLPDLPTEVTGTGVERLRRSIGDRDLPAIARFLESRIMLLRRGILPDGLLPWIVEAALCADLDISRSALQYISYAPEPRSVPLSLLTATLAKLHPNQNLLWSLGLDALQPEGHTLSLDDGQALLLRLVQVVTELGKASAIASEDVSSCVALLIAIGLDDSTILDTQLTIKHTLEALCNAYCSGLDDVRGQIERSICTSLVRFALTLDPANKERLVVLFPRGSVVTKRIGQWVAFGMLSPNPELAVSEAGDGLPPLEQIIALIRPEPTDSSTCSDLFKVRRNDFDYVALTHHTEVLARALDNIRIYATLEVEEDTQGRALVKAASFTSTLSGSSTLEDDGMNESPLSVAEGSSPSKKKTSESRLQQIEDILRRLSARIVDSKTADPSRSCAKVALEKLQIRMKYQREGAVGRCNSSVGRPKMKGIESYLMKK